MRAPKPNDHHHIIYHVHVYILYVRAITGVRVLNEALHPHSEYLIIQLYAGRIKLRLCNIHLLLLPQLTQKKRRKKNKRGAYCNAGNVATTAKSGALACLPPPLIGNV